MYLGGNVMKNPSPLASIIGIVCLAALLFALLRVFDLTSQSPSTGAATTPTLENHSAPPTTAGPELNLDTLDLARRLPLQVEGNILDDNPWSLYPVPMFSPIGSGVLLQKLTKTEWESLCKGSVCGAILHELWYAGSLDKQPRRIAQGVVNQSWSPNGELIAFTQHSPSGDSSLWVMTKRGTDKKLVTKGIAPGFLAWKNNETLIYSSEDGSIFSSALDGKDRFQLNPPTIPRELSRMFQVSPDGERLVLLDDLNYLWMIKLDEVTSPIRIDPFDGSFVLTRGGIAWSPRGDRFAFTSARSIFIIGHEGQPISEVTTGWSPRDLAWSPDGQILAFIDNPEERETFSEIVLTDKKGEKLKQITHDRENAGAGSKYTLTWSPDGNLIYGTSRLPGQKVQRIELARKLNFNDSSATTPEAANQLPERDIASSAAQNLPEPRDCPYHPQNDGTIWVWARDHDPQGLGRTIRIPFEVGVYTQEPVLSNYLAGVLDGEIGGDAETPLASWQPAAAHAMSVAARTVAVFQCARTTVLDSQSNSHFGMNDFQFQVYWPNHSALRAEDYRGFVNATAGQQLIVNGDIVRFLQYRNYTGRTTDNEDPNPPHQSVPDPVAAQDEPHGPGMGQHSANHWALGLHNERLGEPVNVPNVRWTDYRQLLVHYYTGVHLRNANGAVLTPDYRWNLLSHQTMPTQVAPDQSFQVNLQIQNTGVELWDEDRYAIRYQWCASPLPANCPDYSSDPWPLRYWSQASTLPPFILGQANSVTASFLAPSSSGTYELVIDICDPVTPAIAPESIMEGEFCFSRQPGQPDWFFYSFPLTVGTGGPVPTATTEPTTEPTFTSTPTPTATATEPPTATATPTIIATATPPSAQTPTATPSGGGWSLNPIEVVILKGMDAQRTIEYVALLRQVRDEILNTAPRGKRFEDAYYIHLAELTRLMREDEKLRSRARRLMLQIQPALNEWVEAKGDSQTRVKRKWIRAAQLLVNDLRVKASPELAAELEWWQIQIPKSEGKTLPEIWADLLAEPR